MGSDNLYHKRKAKGRRNLQRRNAQRAPYDKVLIVCEGEKTEPHYFKDLISHYQLNSANIEISGYGADPLSIVKHAQARYRAAKKVADAFDRVYCVFDKDQHPSYQQALDSIKKKRAFFAAHSVPCFEYWVLLHFQDTTQPYDTQGVKKADARLPKEAARPLYAVNQSIG